MSKLLFPTYEAVPIQEIESKEIFINPNIKQYYQIPITEKNNNTQSNYSNYTTIEPSSNKFSDNLIKSISNLSGLPYKLGGTSKTGIDCSAFVLQVYAQQGINLPRTAAAQYNATKRVSLDLLLPGDSLYLKDTWKKGISHTGIFMGWKSPGVAKVAESSGKKKLSGIHEWNLNKGYHAQHFAGAGRIIQAKKGGVLILYNKDGNIFSNTSDLIDKYVSLNILSAKLNLYPIYTSVKLEMNDIYNNLLKPYIQNKTFPTFQNFIQSASETASNWYNNFTTSEPSQKKSNNNIKGSISTGMFNNLLRLEGSQNLTATVHKNNFGENFVTGPYGMVYKYDSNGNITGTFKNGEKMSNLEALENAKRYYNKRYNEIYNLFKDKPGLTQNKIEAMVSATGGTTKSKNAFLNFMQKNWGNDKAITNYWRNYALTASGNNKILKGLVNRRNFEVNWFYGNKS